MSPSSLPTVEDWVRETGNNDRLPFIEGSM